ncbi:hypothetical protein LCGC14_2985680 [marine sediment metagenome]|uniref:Uncharacterized protein n=1 Tax=marine sediment metagenome TaxID=412755 RepID=A0A0F8XEP5_9ZZZZ
MFQAQTWQIERAMLRYSRYEKLYHTIDSESVTWWEKVETLPLIYFPVQT